MREHAHRRLVRRADASSYVLSWQEQGWIPRGPAVLHLEGAWPQDDILAVDLGPADPGRTPVVPPSITSPWPALHLSDSSG